MTPPPPDRPAAGIGYIVVAMALFSGMDAVAKWLVDDFSIFQILALRGIFSIGLLLPFLVRSYGIAGIMRTQNLKGQVLRSLFGVGAMFGFFSALREMQLADATAIGFSGSLFMAALAVPLLRERVGPRRWMAILFGFCGVLIIVQPGTSSFKVASLLVVLSALLYALMMISTRWLSRTETNASMVFYHALVSTLIGLVALPFLWVSPSPTEWGLFATMGVLGTLAHLAIAQAFRLAQVAVVGPFEYSTLLWATIIGFVVWHEVPGANVWYGSSMLVVAGVYILYREAKLSSQARRAVRDAAAITK
ncbi:MAG: DMT family transporter [Proteobacteria bacterium]|nr:DMT family transporter [Pseudomonadota bacterium]MDA1058525.1 DMT family transporter [Pseudomonadota bacterium]